MCAGTDRAQGSRPAIALAVLLWAVTGCQRAGSGATEAPQPLHLTPVVEGLRPGHTGAPPLVEMVSCPPGGPCLTSRVYRDGALYYLADEPGGVAHWNPIAQLSPEGTRSLEALYAELCGRTDPVMADDHGSMLHRVTSPGCTQELVVTGIPSGELARIEEATDIINRSILRAPAVP